MTLTETAAQALYDAQEAHEADSDKPSAAQILAQIWCRYRDRKGRPDPDQPSTPADRDRRVEPLIAVYTAAHGKGNEPAVVLTDIIADLLHFAYNNNVLNLEEGETFEPDSLLRCAVSYFEDEREGKNA